MAKTNFAIAEFLMMIEYAAIDGGVPRFRAQNVTTLYHSNDRQRGTIWQWKIESLALAITFQRVERNSR